MANGGIIGPVQNPTRGAYTTTYTASGSYTSPGYGPGNANYLIVAGGGGGGNQGGGGGAGEVAYYASYPVNAGTYTVVVGGGGLGGQYPSPGNSDGADGDPSSFGTLTANGGGAGSTASNGNTGFNGGSGGGSGRQLGTGGASVKTAGGRGNAGGTSPLTGTQSGAGGGGAGSAGTDAPATSGSTPIPGGSGYTSSISGAAVTYGSGGTGGARNGTYTPGDGTANRGDGGDAGCNNGGVGQNGAAGGSGIVIVSYSAASFAPTFVSGEYRKAVSFNNQNAATTAANAYATYALTSGTSNSYTVSCWINPLHAFPTTTLNPNYLVIRDTGGYYSIQTIAASSTSGFYANEGVTGGQGTTFSGLLTTGKWDHHCFVLSNVGATSSNTIVTYYLNGTTLGTGNVQRTNGFSTFSALYLGYRSGSTNSGAWCSLDDLRLYNGALNATQVQALYAANGVPPPVALGNLTGTSVSAGSAYGGTTLLTQVSPTNAVVGYSLRAINAPTAVVANVAVQISLPSFTSAATSIWPRLTGM